MTFGLRSAQAFMEHPFRNPSQFEPCPADPGPCPVCGQANTILRCLSCGQRLCQDDVERHLCN